VKKMPALNKIIVFGMILVFLCSFVSADSLCRESDNGKEYDVKGYVQYGVTKYEDLCVLKPDADMRLPESQYLKEYYCESDARTHKIVDCKREGYDKCKDGVCVSSQTTTATGNTTVKNTTKYSVYTAPYCGDKKVGTGEECDPPDKICYKGTDIGLCSAACKCAVKISGGHVVSGNQTAKPEITVQDAAKNKTTDTSITTAKAEAKEEVKEETTATKTASKSAKKEVQDPDGVSTEKERLSLPKEQKKGLFKRIWSWLFG
jgi:hypothetical protein